MEQENNNSDAVRESYGSSLKNFWLYKVDKDEWEDSCAKARKLIDEFEAEIRKNIMAGKEPVAVKSSINTTFGVIQDTEFAQLVSKFSFRQALKDIAKSEKLEISIQQQAFLNPETKQPVIGVEVACTF